MSRDLYGVEIGLESCQGVCATTDVTRQRGRKRKKRKKEQKLYWVASVRRKGVGLIRLWHATESRLASFI